MQARPPEGPQLDAVDVTRHSIVRPVGREMNFLPSCRAMQTDAQIALRLLSPISSPLPAIVPLSGQGKGEGEHLGRDGVP